MKNRMYIRLFFLILVVSASLVLFSWSRTGQTARSGKDECAGKCEQKKSQTEFILWESLLNNLLSFNH